MTATRKNIRIEQGATFTASFDIPDSIDGDLSAMAAFMDIRLAPGAPPVASLSSDGGGLVVSNMTRKIAARVDADITALMRPRCYFYDVKLVDSDGTVYRVDQGFAVADAQVTGGGDEPPPPDGDIFLSMAGDQFAFQDGSLYQL